VSDNDISGWSLSSGDINGDGITDLLIGAPYAPAGAWQGASYIIFGARRVFPATISLSSLNGINGFTVTGASNGDLSGCSLSTGDINGDGITDLLIGAYGGPEKAFRGTSYVVFGTRSAFPATLSLSSLNGINGFSVTGINDGDYSGRTLSSSDINGDDITDLLIGAPRADDSQGVSYVIFGSRAAFPATTSLSSLNGTNGFAVIGIHKDDISGFSLSGGDINGDGIADLLVGAWGAPANAKQGASYVIFGSRGAFPANISLSNLNGANGFAVIGENNNDGSGYALSSGDINGDGIADLLIGAWYAPAGANRGASYVIFGRCAPTTSPTESPTENPTELPTQNPTHSPSDSPTLLPTSPPTSPPAQSSTHWLLYAAAAAGGAIALTAVGYFARRKCKSSQRNHLQEPQGVNSDFYPLENKEEAPKTNKIGLPKPFRF
jgi:hypothetical protein